MFSQRTSCNVSRFLWKYVVNTSKHLLKIYQFATQRLLSGLASAVSWPAPKFKNKAVLGAWLVLNISKVGAQFASHPRLVNKQGNLLKGINNKTIRTLEDMDEEGTVVIGYVKPEFKFPAKID